MVSNDESVPKLLWDLLFPDVEDLFHILSDGSGVYATVVWSNLKGIVGAVIDKFILSCDGLAVDAHGKLVLLENDNVVHVVQRYRPRAVNLSDQFRVFSQRIFVDCDLINVLQVFDRDNNSTWVLLPPVRNFELEEEQPRISESKRVQWVQGERQVEASRISVRCDTNTEAEDNLASR